MKIFLNERISMLSETFHRGDLSLTDYREQRRKELEALNQTSDQPLKNTNGHSKVIIKRVLVGTLVAISLIFTTVMLAKFLL